ncbi:hypothetical protein J4217_00050 [Candidatus Pacearchaeota archaeon]|nr:hypothetical protein [Candidatus Pacearchaeota archaeon]
MGDAPDLIDYTALKKRGLIKTKDLGKANITKDGYLDIGAMNAGNPELSNASSGVSSYGGYGSSNTASGSSSQQTPSFNSFWNDLPGQSPSQTANTTQSVSATSTNNETSYYNNNSATSSYYNQPTGVSDNNLSSNSLNELKLKLEDMEYKLSRLTEKLELISSKLLGFESKVT